MLGVERVEPWRGAVSSLVDLDGVSILTVAFVLPQVFLRVWSWDLVWAIPTAMLILGVGLAPNDQHTVDEFWA